MSESDKLLHDIVKSHAESATATKLLLKNIFEVLTAMAVPIGDIRTFMTELKTERDTFYRSTVKVFLVVFFAQLVIIGLLLKELNVKGADAVLNTGQRGISGQVR
jgi:hypothetical protein